MGTRGFWGFVLDDEEKLAYNHWDSYPAGLGATVLEFCQDVVVKDRFDLVRGRVRDLKLITSETPTPDDVEHLAPYTDLTVGARTTTDWYCLLRRAQGDPWLTLDAGYMEDAGDFPLDSLFAEWGYVVNLDTHLLEVYRGFQTSKHQLGRFASRVGKTQRGEISGSFYYPVALTATLAFDLLPTEHAFVEMLDPDGDE